MLIEPEDLRGSASLMFLIIGLGEKLIVGALSRVHVHRSTSSTDSTETFNECFFVDLIDEHPGTSATLQSRVLPLRLSKYSLLCRSPRDGLAGARADVIE